MSGMILHGPPDVRQAEKPALRLVREGDEDACMDEGVASVRQAAQQRERDQIHVLANILASMDGHAMPGPLSDEQREHYRRWAAIARRGSATRGRSVGVDAVARYRVSDEAVIDGYLDALAGEEA